MSTEVERPDGSVLANIPDNTTDVTSSSLTLYGSGSGTLQTLDDDLVSLLTNFASPNPPETPQAGQLWFNTTDSSLNLFTSNSAPPVNITGMVNTLTSQIAGVVTQADINESVSAAEETLNANIAAAQAELQEAINSSNSTIVGLQDDSTTLFYQLGSLATRLLNLQNSTADSNASFTTSVAAVASSTMAIAGEITTINTNIANNSAAITAETAARTTAEAALASSITTLNTQVTNDAAAAALSASNASSSASAAASSALSAAGSASAAGTSATNAANSAYGAANSASAASTSASTASTQASQAASSATSAQTSANTATTEAGAASTSAASAATSATTAAGNASTSGTNATNAANSATAAAGSATAASGSASVASTQATNAYNSATSAQNYSNTASSQAANALSSANAASTSASGASTSASNASSSATAAAGSATSASTSAGSAGTYATNASNSATAAAGSASSASGSATTAGNYATNAGNSAASASTYATNASNSAASAASSATLSASVGGGVLNANPVFSSYPTSPGLPTGWNNWAGGPIGTSGTGSNPTVGGNSYTTTTGSSNTGLSQGISYLTTGYYVLEATVYLSSGTYQGAGMYLDTATWGGTLDFSVDPDISGATGATGASTRSYSKIVNCTVAGIAQLYLMSYWTAGAFPGGATSKTITWYRGSVRPATAGEIAGNSALSGLATTNATVSSNQSAQATINSANSTSISTLNSQIYSNPNLVPNGNFTGYGTGNNFAGWTMAAGATTYADPHWGQLAYVPNIQTNNQVIATSPNIPIGAGTTYTLSGNLQISIVAGAPTGSACYLDRIYFNSSGTQIYDGGQNIAAYSLSSNRPSYVYTETAPAGTTYCTIRLVAGTTGDASDYVTCYFQNIKLEIGSVVTAYNDSTTLVSMSSEINTVNSTLTTATSTAASSITVLQSRLNTGTNVNLIQNPSFQQGFTGWTNYYGGTYNYAQFGTAVEYYPGSGNLGYNYRAVCATVPISVSAGGPFSFQVVMYSGGVGSTNTYQRCAITWFNSSGSVISGGALFQTNLAQTWTRYLCDANNLNGFSYVTAPSGAYTAIITCDILTGDGSNITGSGDGFIWGSMKFEQGIYCTPFTDTQLAATVSNQASTIATLQGYTDAHLVYSTTTGGGTALFTLDSNTYGTSIGLTANQVYFGPYMQANEASSVFQVTAGAYTLYMGAGFGASSNLAFAFASNSYAISSLTTSNCLWCFDTSGLVHYGGAVLNAAPTTGTLSNTSAASTFYSSGWATYGIVAFSNVPSGSYWTNTFGSIQTTTASSPSSGTTTSISWRIVEAPHGTSSYTTINSGSFSGTWVGGEGWGFPTSASINNYYTFGAGPAAACVNSGAVDVLLQFYDSAPSSIAHVTGTVSATWGAGG